MKHWKIAVVYSLVPSKVGCICNMLAVIDSSSQTYAAYLISQCC